METADKRRSGNGLPVVTPPKPGDERLTAFANEVGLRLKLLLRPTVMADVMPFSNSRIVFYRRGLLDADTPSVWRRCLACDNGVKGELRLSISAVNPILDIGEKAIIHMLCCDSAGCREKVDTVTDQVFYDDKFREALDAIEHSVS